ncbi:hypothetical protein GY45DRAFT_1340980 [Cubamyces sp. BRFM 1775]|nr:hypothetical protein GY45DRAFT_1340980 [Cubamyces sp. BRFM 1775]
MDTLKRIFSKGKASRPGPKVKLYCKYPGCGRPFYPEHKIDCFCSPECLQDYNYTPPSHWFADVPSNEVQRHWWSSHKRNASVPVPVKRSASIAILNPAPHRSIRHRRKHSDRPAGGLVANAFAGTSGQYATHTAQPAVRIYDYTTKPLPQLPVNDNGMHTMAPVPVVMGGTPIDTTKNVIAPVAIVLTTPKERAPVTMHARRQELVLVHQYAGIDERGFPYTVPVMMDPASAEAYRRRPPQIPLPPIPTHVPAPMPPSTARRRPGAMARHGPRPRSNSFGGFHYAARA